MKHFKILPAGLALLLTLVSLAAPESLLDGRLLDGKTTLPGPSLADLPAIEEEVRRKASEPYLKAFVGQVQIAQGSDQFMVSGGVPGSFTRPGAKQKLFLYRLGLTSGVIILENGAVVGHYNGVPSEYAHYISAQVADLNQDGRTDLVLSHNVEDSEEIEAHFFVMTPQGPRFLGETPVFRSNVLAGDPPPTRTEADAYEIWLAPGAGPMFVRSHFHRVGSKAWAVQSEKRPFKLESSQAPGFEPKLINLSASSEPQQAKIQLALGKLASYSDVGSSLNYKHPANAAETLVAGDPSLRLMELLDTRAAVYAYENATKKQTDHRRPKDFALTLQGLSSREQIRKAYQVHTNESLGGMSPYQER
ncbi:hypothetical protein JST97_04330 [bacterium]|nr:hypothetical protein [bacterium]